MRSVRTLVIFFRPSRRFPPLRPAHSCLLQVRGESLQRSRKSNPRQPSARWTRFSSTSSTLFSGGHRLLKNPCCRSRSLGNLRLFRALLQDFRFSRAPRNQAPISRSLSIARQESLFTPIPSSCQAEGIGSPASPMWPRRGRHRCRPGCCQQPHAAIDRQQLQLPRKLRNVDRFPLFVSRALTVDRFSRNWPRAEWASWHRSMSQQYLAAGPREITNTWPLRPCPRSDSGRMFGQRHPVPDVVTSLSSYFKAPCEN